MENYEKEYYNLIENAKKQNRTKNDGIYYEKHHIIPKSLGGSDTEDNLVLLTAEEHYNAHYYLWMFKPCKQTAYAFYMMNTMISTTQNRIKNAELFKIAREAFNFYNKQPRKKQSLEQIEHRRKLNTGKKRTEETKQKMSNSMKKFYENETEEERKLRIEKVKNETKKAMWKDDIREKYLNSINNAETKLKHKENIHKYWANAENHKKHSDACKGRKLSEETKKKISNTQKGKKLSDEQKQKRHEKLLQNENYKKRHENSLKKREEKQKLISLNKKLRHEKSLLKIKQKEELLNESCFKWWNNGLINKRCLECPGDGWVRGRIRI